MTLLSHEREQNFPNLPGHYSVHSAETPDLDYNCIAWAAHDTHRWWEPSGNPGTYWPSGVPRHNTVHDVRLALATVGFELCPDASTEQGHEKIAIYGLARGRFSHVARGEDGQWTSKLGAWEDIEHDTLESLESAFYGTVVTFMKRPTIA